MWIKIDLIGPVEVLGQNPIMAVLPEAPRRIEMIPQGVAPIEVATPLQDIGQEPRHRVPPAIPARVAVRRVVAPIEVPIQVPGPISRTVVPLHRTAITEVLVEARQEVVVETIGVLVVVPQEAVGEAIGVPAAVHQEVAAVVSGVLGVLPAVGVLVAPDLQEQEASDNKPNPISRI